MLDDFLAAGGTTIDTANGYQSEQSEKWIGEWMAARGVRDRMVIATKYTTDFTSHAIGKNESANLAGNHRKSLHVSLHRSLEKLQTDYIDLFYVHWWDWSTSIEEVMDALDVEVKAGRVLYLGASDMPAWVISACNEYASARGKTPFSVLQTQWNVTQRDIERDLLPMARLYGMAIVPWSALGSGKLKNAEALEKALQDGALKESSVEVKYSRALLGIAKKRGLDSFAPIALSYLFTKYRRTFPIIGFQTRDQLHDNIRALDITLTEEEMTELENLEPLDLGFPGNMIGQDPRLNGGRPGGNVAMQLGTIDWPADRTVWGR